MRLYKRCACANRKACRHPFWYAFKLHHHKHRGSTRTANRKLAERIASRQRNDVLEGRAGLKRTPPVRLSEHIKAYVAHTAKTNRSAYKDAAVLQGFMESVGDRLITEISPFHIERWKHERAGDVSRSTVNRELNIIRGCFSRAVEWDRLSLSPMRRIKAYRVDDARLRVCTPAEIKTLLEGTPKPTKHHRKPRKGAVALADLRLLARLTLESLPRLSECLALRRDDIGSTYLTIVRSKSGRARQVPLTPELRADLLARCHASGSVFGVGTEGEPPKAAAVSVAFARLAAALKLPGVSHHTFRHTGASVMVANGVSLRAVQMIGGWTSLRMVERYAHLDDAELQRAVRVTHNHAEAAKQGGTKGDTATGRADAKSQKLEGEKA